MIQLTTQSVSTEVTPLQSHKSGPTSALEQPAPLFDKNQEAPMKTPGSNATIFEISDIAETLVTFLPLSSVKEARQLAALGQGNSTLHTAVESAMNISFKKEAAEFFQKHQDNMNSIVDKISSYQPLDQTDASNLKIQKLLLRASTLTPQSDKELASMEIDLGLVTKTVCELGNNTDLKRSSEQYEAYQNMTNRELESAYENAQLIGGLLQCAGVTVGSLATMAAAHTPLPLVFLVGYATFSGATNGRCNNAVSHPAARAFQALKASEKPSFNPTLDYIRASIQPRFAAFPPVVLHPIAAQPIAPQPVIAQPL